MTEKLNREELYEYIKNRKDYFCTLCYDLQQKVIKEGIDAIKEYQGMQCAGIQDMIFRYGDTQRREDDNT